MGRPSDPPRALVALLRTSAAHRDGMDGDMWSGLPPADRAEVMAYMGAVEAFHLALATGADDPDRPLGVFDASTRDRLETRIVRLMAGEPAEVAAAWELALAAARSGSTARTARSDGCGADAVARSPRGWATGVGAPGGEK